MTTAVGDTKFILAIDLGSGGPKVALVSEQGEEVACTVRRTRTFILPGGGAEQDPDEWWRAITDGVRELVARRLVPPARIIAVSCASQWSVTVAVNRQGRALMRAVHWIDGRGAPYTHRITDGLIKVSGYGLSRLLRWVRMTGGMPTHSGADALAHILFIKHERPDVYRQTHKFLEPMDYMNARLTGRFAASQSTIFPYLLTDNRDNTRIDYDPVLLTWSGIDREKLPDLVPVDAVLGPVLPEIADEWGLPPGTQVVAGNGDSQSAALGSGAVADYQGHVCIGTSAWLSCHVPFKKTHLADYLATMPAAIRGRNMVVAEQGAAGKCLEAFVDNWLYPRDELADGPPPADVYERLHHLAAGVPPGSERLIFLPWLNGAGPPSGDGAIRGGFLNQSLRTGRAHAVRAVLEGVAYNLRWLSRSVERFIGRPFATLNFIGGGARSEVWCQILADVLDRPIRQVANPNLAIVRGAAYAGLIALGRLRPEDVPRIVRIARTFEPLPANRAIYQELFAEFLNGYKANKRIFRRLNARR